MYTSGIRHTLSISTPPIRHVCVGYKAYIKRTTGAAKSYIEVVTPPLQAGNTHSPLKINEFVQPCPLPVIFNNFPHQNLNNFKTLTIDLLIQK